MSDKTRMTRERMVELLNEDLAREYQAIIAYTIYSQTLKGAEYNHIAQELEKHAGEELQHAIKIAKQIDYFNGTPTNKPKEVKMSDKARDMLKFDLENERQTLINYRQRVRQADEMGEYALGEVLREIIAQEQEHLQDLADALGIDTPKLE
ncbi:MAG: ferritin-like domain-containing protein [Verrucomicrobia bacterium]|nr:ferritin-like domain-containing protein [Verrucomicrobiota bacterium]